MTGWAGWRRGSGAAQHSQGRDRERDANAKPRLDAGRGGQRGELVERGDGVNTSVVTLERSLLQMVCN